MGPGKVLRRVVTAALDLVVPPACLACSAPSCGRAGLCDRCERMLVRQPPTPCPRCAAPLGPGVDPSACGACARLRPRFASACAAVRYVGLGGELVRRAKYGGDPLLATPLARLVAEALERWPGRAGVHVVVPVPTTRARRRDRGFHLADVLAADAARRVGAPLRAAGLARVGDPAPQASLPRSERIDAARGSVALRRGVFGLLPPADVRGRTVLLVDDVMTTGATANEAARVLLLAGAAEVRVVVAARA